MRVTDVFSLTDGEETGAPDRESKPDQIVELMPQQPLGIIERATIDMQIATAKQFPRSITDALEKAKSLACFSPLVASQCTYRVPRGHKHITGPSIRVAEIMGTQWGNLRYGGRVLAVGERTVSCQGVCHDLETNVSVSVEVTRSIVDKDGHRYSEDMIVTTSMAGIAIAIRNAIFKIIPGAFVTEVLTAAQKVARGEEKGLETRLADALEYFESINVSKELVFMTLGIAGAADVKWEHIDLLLGYATSIRVEGLPKEEIFKPKASAEAPPADPPPPPETPPGAPDTKTETPPTTPPAATETPPETPSSKAPAIAFEDAVNALGVAGASWDHIYKALGLSDAGELSMEHKVTVCTWGGRVKAGEKLEDVLKAPETQTTAGPPTGDAVFGAKAAAAAAATEAQDEKPKTTSSPRLDF